MQDRRIALVTGANQGVGLQVAKELVANGLTVLVGSRNLERGEAAAKDIGPGAVAIQIDVTDQVSISAAAERIGTEFGRLDLLVNNAGISNTSKGSLSLEEYAKLTKASNASLDEVRAVWETNVFGVLAVYQAMLPLIRESSDARIVNVSSGVGSLTTNADPEYPRHANVRPRLPRVEVGSQRHHACHDDRVGVDRHQGQPGLACLHQHEPQRIRRNGVCRGRLSGGRTRRTTRSGRSHRHVHEMGERNDSMVSCPERYTAHPIRPRWWTSRR